MPDGGARSADPGPDALSAAGGSGVPGSALGARPYPDDPPRPPDVRTTTVLEVPTAEPAGYADAGRSGLPWRRRLAPAAAAVRQRADVLAGRYRAAPRDVRLALVGSVVTVVSFLLLPYAARAGSAFEVGGRLWWRPLTAVAATILLATTLRPAAPVNLLDRLVAAVVVATIGATEAGLVGLVSGDANGARIGYYGMLAGLVTVLFATARAARRRGAP
jgi:hypothetical protein